MVVLLVGGVELSINAAAPFWLLNYNTKKRRELQQNKRYRSINK